MSYNEYGQAGYGRSNPYQHQQQQQQAHQQRPNPYQQEQQQQQRPNPYGQQRPPPRQSSSYGQGGYGRSSPHQQQQQQSQPAPYGRSSPYQDYAQQREQQPERSPYSQQRPQPNQNPPPYSSDYPPNEAHDQAMEMKSYPQQQPPYGAPAASLPQSQDPDAILNACKKVDAGVDTLDELLERLQTAHRRALNDASASGNTPSSREVDSLNADIMAAYKNMLDRMKWIKKQPESDNPRNRPQIGRVDRRLKATYAKYQTIESEYKKRVREQIERQLRIVKPDITPEEVQEACNEPNQQVFSQALLNSDRRGMSRTVLSAVQARHEAIAKVERQMIELAQLFQEMEAIVIQQEPQIQQIERQAEETYTNVEEGNKQLVVATKKARSARKKKWCCIGITILIILILIVGALVVLAAIHII